MAGGELQGRLLTAGWIRYPLRHRLCREQSAGRKAKISHSQEVVLWTAASRMDTESIMGGAPGGGADTAAAGAGGGAGGTPVGNEKGGGGRGGKP